MIKENKNNSNSKFNSVKGDFLGGGDVMMRSKKVFGLYRGNKQQYDYDSKFLFICELFCQKRLTFI